jgi:hypothetical protein
VAAEAEAVGFLVASLDKEAAAAAAAPDFAAAVPGMAACTTCVFTGFINEVLVI